jgi:hypothetical protein
MVIDPASKEDKGWHHSNFYLSRPIENHSSPLRKLLSKCAD